MRILKSCFTILALATCSWATTHIVDSLKYADDVTPFAGKVYFAGPYGSPTVAPTNLPAVTIGAAGAIDVSLVGCHGCWYRVSFQLTNSRGTTTQTWAEKWVVPDTSATLTRALVIDSSEAPNGTLNPQRMGSEGLSAGQVWVWDGVKWIAATNAAGGSGMADPGANGVMKRTGLNTTGVVTGDPADCVLVDGTSGPCGTGTGGAVDSVAGRTGAVVLGQSDITGLVSALAAKGDVSTSGSYSNPAWITALAYAKITGVPSFLTAVPAPGASTLGGVKSGQCTTTTGKLMGYDTAGDRICEADQTSGGGGGIGTLNTLTAGTQAFAKVDDTNVLLGIESSGSTHTFTLSWTGQLAKARQHALTLYSDGSYSDPSWLTLSIAKITGLQAALDAKQASLGFTPVPNTRTVNGQALSADITISAGLTGFIDSNDYASFALACSAAVSATKTLLVSKTWSALTTQSCAAPIFFTRLGLLTPASGQTVTLSGSIIAGLHQVFSVASGGTVAISGKTPMVYPEWWGAVGDGATNDKVAIQAANNALIANGGGIVHFGPNVYLHAGELSVSSHTWFQGSGLGFVAGTPGVTKLLNSSTTGNSIAFNGTGAFCAAGSIDTPSVTDMNIERVTPATAGHGIYVYKACGPTLKNLYIVDSFDGTYQEGTAATNYERVYVYFSNSSGSTRYGFDFLNESVSTKGRWMTVTGTGANVTGLHATGCISDLFILDFETATTDYGIDLNNTVGGTTCAEDVRFTRVTLDRILVRGIRVQGFTGTRPSAIFSDLYYQTSTSSTVGFDVQASYGIQLSQCTMLGIGVTQIGVRINQSHNAVISGCKIDNMASPIILSDNSVNNSVTNNMITGDATYPVTTGISLLTAAVNVVTGNHCMGYVTTCISADATSGANVLWPNMQDNGGHVGTMISNGAVGNVATGLGSLAPAVATCGTIGTGSTNSAGFITSGTTGTCAPVVTFDRLLSGNASTGWACSMTNSTNPANLIQQTASSTTTATFSGTTVSGDVLRYQCTAY